MINYKNDGEFVQKIFGNVQKKKENYNYCDILIRWRDTKLSIDEIEKIKKK